MAEVDLLGVFVVLEHREIDDPAEFVGVLLDQAQFGTDAGTGEPGQLGRLGFLAGGEETAIIRAKAERLIQRQHAFLAMVLGDGAAELTALAGDIAETGIAFAARPFVHVVEELAALFGRAGRRNGAHDVAALHHLGEQAKARPDEVAADIADDDRVAQVGLVVAVLQHRFRIGNARERALGDRPRITAAEAGELFKHPGQHGFDGSEHVFLGDKAHFEIELVEFTRAAISPRVFIAEAGRDLEIAIKAGDHQQLLEHLRRLGKRIEFPRMHAAGHQIIARAFRAARRQDRRLEFHEPLIDHAAAQRRNHIAAQHDVLVQAVATQIEEAILQADILGIFGLTGHRHRQFIGGGLDGDILGAHFHFAGGQPAIDGAAFAQHDITNDGDHRFHPDAVQHRERRRRRAGNDLGQAMVIAQIDEQHAAMIALAVDPARQFDRLAGIGGAQGGAVVGAINVHFSVFRQLCFEGRLAHVIHRFVKRRDWSNGPHADSSAGDGHRDSRTTLRPLGYR